MRAGYVCACRVCVSIIQQILTWTTGSITCTQTLMRAIAHRGVQIPKESLQWKMTLGRKSLVAPGNRTCVSGMTIRCSTNWATSPPYITSRCDHFVHLCKECKVKKKKQKKKGHQKRCMKLRIHLNGILPEWAGAHHLQAVASLNKENKNPIIYHIKEKNHIAVMYSLAFSPCLSLCTYKNRRI